MALKGLQSARYSITPRQALHAEIRGVAISDLDREIVDARRELPD